MLSNEATFSVAGPSEDCGKVRIYEENRGLEPFSNFDIQVPRIAGHYKNSLRNFSTKIMPTK